jgi:RHS repeat-associated protein
LAIDRGWLGQYEDSDTGLTYLNARYYDPILGRFLSPDPLMNPGDPRTLDPYRYADNNPISYTDPSGLAPQLCFFGLIADSLCPSAGQTVTSDPARAGLIDSGVDAALGTGYALSADGIADNWNAYAEAVRGQGVVGGTTSTFIGAPIASGEAALGSSVNCLSSPVCLASPQKQYAMGYGSGQLAIPVVSIGYGATTGFAFRGFTPSPAMNTWLSTARVNVAARVVQSATNRAARDYDRGIIGLTPAQTAAAKNNPRLEPMFRGYQIDKVVKSQVSSHPLVKNVLQTTKPGQKGPDFVVKPSKGSPSGTGWLDITTYHQWAAHQQRYGNLGMTPYYGSGRHIVLR